MKKISILLSMFSLLSLAWSCTKFEEPESIQNVENPTDPPELTRNGSSTYEKMENPYALKVMQEIYDEYDGGVTLKPTDLYVKFLPQDSLQSQHLRDIGLELFDYPLDIKLQEGEEYVDPCVPEGTMGWLYTTVKPNFQFPSDIPFKIIESCYIPEDGETIDIEPMTRTGPSNIDVERAAFEKLGYTLEPAPMTRASARYPSGEIMVWDDSKSPAGFVPVKGVKIRCHVVVKWATAYTNENGRYNMGRKFLIGPHYAIVYKNTKDFTIWGNWGFLAPANHNMGWHSNSGHSEYINVGWKSRPWAVVNNAAYEYYKMCEATGIYKPPSGLKIWVFRNGENNAAMMLRRISFLNVFTEDNWVTYLLAGTVTTIPLDVLYNLVRWALPDLVIGTKQRTTYDQIYEVVSHELSHASHFSKAGDGYWAKYISHIIDKNGYGSSRSGTNVGVCEVGEMWGFTMGRLLQYEKYFPTLLSNPYSVNFGSIKNSSWLQPDPIWALITRGILTKKQIFDCLTSDIVTRAKLIDKMCANYPDRAVFIRAAFDNMDVSCIPTITGPDSPDINSAVTYAFPPNSTVASTLFTGWSITGNGVSSADYQISGLPTNHTLKVTFKTVKSYKITANFRLPGVTSDYSITTTVNARTVATPQISYYTYLLVPGCSTTGSGQLMSVKPPVDLKPIDPTPVYPVDPNRRHNKADIYVTNPQTGTTYEWKVNDIIIRYGAIRITQDLKDDPFYVSCRAHRSGMTSAWSMPIKVGVIDIDESKQILLP